MNTTYLFKSYIPSRIVRIVSPSTRLYHKTTHTIRHVSTHPLSEYVLSSMHDDHIMVSTHMVKMDTSYDILIEQCAHDGKYHYDIFIRQYGDIIYNKHFVKDVQWDFGNMMERYKNLQPFSGGCGGARSACKFFMKPAFNKNRYFYYEYDDLSGLDSFMSNVQIIDMKLKVEAVHIMLYDTLNSKMRDIGFIRNKIIGVFKESHCEMVHNYWKNQIFLFTQLNDRLYTDLGDDSKLVQKLQIDKRFRMCLLCFVYPFLWWFENFLKEIIRQFQIGYKKSESKCQSKYNILEKIMIDYEELYMKVLGIGKYKDEHIDTKDIMNVMERSSFKQDTINFIIKDVIKKISDESIKKAIEQNREWIDFIVENEIKRNRCGMSNSDLIEKGMYWRITSNQIGSQFRHELVTEILQDISLNDLLSNRVSIRCITPHKYNYHTHYEMNVIDTHDVVDYPFLIPEGFVYTKAESTTYDNNLYFFPRLRTNKKQEVVKIEEKIEFVQIRGEITCVVVYRDWMYIGITGWTKKFGADEGGSYYNIYRIEPEKDSLEATASLIFTHSYTHSDNRSRTIEDHIKFTVQNHKIIGCHIHTVHDDNNDDSYTILSSSSIFSLSNVFSKTDNTRPPYTYMSINMPNRSPIDQTHTCDDSMILESSDKFMICKWMSSSRYLYTLGKVHQDDTPVILSLYKISNTDESLRVLDRYEIEEKHDGWLEDDSTGYNLYLTPNKSIDTLILISSSTLKYLVISVYNSRLITSCSFKQVPFSSKKIGSDTLHMLRQSNTSIMSYDRKSGKLRIAYQEKKKYNADSFTYIFDYIIK